MAFVKGENASHDDVVRRSRFSTHVRVAGGDNERRRRNCSDTEGLELESGAAGVSTRRGTGGSAAAAIPLRREPVCRRRSLARGGVF
ncbi:MAG: hypothetical protein BJ554DRAFT_8443 [Olpidium bornovanus]|uniref:Uncharacterized protein n=1 Tax=Olpidium bornovanus TaxID=278681 RepID=A0A8H8A2I9_9FUNG|nr:MAG: hypothetical protein BJ554DRAFT_8443 [Olpidium bornovanus]